MPPRHSGDVSSPFRRCNEVFAFDGMAAPRGAWQPAGRHGLTTRGTTPVRAREPARDPRPARTREQHCAAAAWSLVRSGVRAKLGQRKAGARNIRFYGARPTRVRLSRACCPRAATGVKSCVHPRIRVASRCAQTCEVLAGCTTKPRRVTPKPRSRCFSQDQRECELLLLGYSVTGEVGARCAQISLRASILAGSVSACARS